MENCAFGWQNRILDAALTADNKIVSALPVTNIQNPHGVASLGYRTLTDSYSDSAHFTASLISEQTFRAFSLHRTNLPASGARWRIQASISGTSVLDWVGGCSVSNGQCIHVLDSEISADTVTFTVWPQTTGISYLDIPLVYAGPLWQPIRNYSSESTSDRVLGQDSVTTLSGSEFVENRWYQRKLSISHQSLGDADSGVMNQILRVAATGRNILFMPDPSADAADLADRSVFGRLSGGDLSNPFGNADRHALTLDLTERL